MTYHEQKSNQAPKPGSGCLALIIKVISGLGIYQAANPADSALNITSSTSTAETKLVARPLPGSEGKLLAHQLRMAIGRRASDDLTQD